MGEGGEGGKDGWKGQVKLLLLTRALVAAWTSCANKGANTRSFSQGTVQAHRCAVNIVTVTTWAARLAVASLVVV